MLELTSVVKRISSEFTLGPIDLSVPAGTVTILIGPSGCGKSTLLRMLNGLVWPDNGTVEFEGTNLFSSHAQVMEARRRMGYVIQEGGLFPHLTARGNVQLMAKTLGISEAERNARVAELSALTQFPEDALDRRPTELSGGQRQRVSLMRALMLDPDLLLLDEPLGALDPMIRADLQDELKGVFEKLKKTVVMVTHDLGEAAFFADTVALIRDGRIVQIGPAKELIEKPAEEFVSKFVTAQRRPLEALG
ncbi:MAG: ATP-binding cassette domain-containing protein [Fimbriimonadales bacterium]